MFKRSVFLAGTIFITHSQGRGCEEDTGDCNQDMYNSYCSESVKTKLTSYTTTKQNVIFEWYLDTKNFKSMSNKTCLYKQLVCKPILLHTFIHSYFFNICIYSSVVERFFSIRFSTDSKQANVNEDI